MSWSQRELDSDPSALCKSSLSVHLLGALWHRVPPGGRAKMLRRMNTPSPRRISPVNPRSSNTSVPPATRPAAPDTAIGSSQWLSGAIIEGHYQVGSLIGRGGMSEVYYALVASCREGKTLTR